MAPTKCEACNNEILEDIDRIACNGRCKLFFHIGCVGFSRSSYRSLPKDKKASWTCPACQKSGVNSTNDTGKQTSDLAKLIEDMKRENDIFRSEVLQKLQDFQASLDFTTNFITETKESNEKLHEELKTIKDQNLALLQENRTLKCQIAEMKSDLVDLQQYSRRLNVEISNMPEVPEENTAEVARNIMKALDVDLINSVTTVHRVPTVKKGKIKPIIMQFNSLNSKSDFMKAAKLKRINAKSVDSNIEEIPVYINDHLCSELKKLLYDCKIFKRENNFKFCWSKGGKIFLRKTEGSKIYRIKTNSDLNNILSDTSK